MRELAAGEPRAIGAYRLVGVIGEGGMGRVYLGIGPDGRLAAVKQVLGSIAEDPGFRARFAHEVEASRRVSGAHTAAVLDADPGAPMPWLASLYVPGPSLHQAVTTTGPLPEGALRRLAVGLAAALADIHRGGLVHRDLKPANVLLAEDGPRVIDFGIARVVHDAAPLTLTGAVVGSPGYLSPEQLDGRPVTPASDVFALGAVLAFAAGGAAPFAAGTPQAMLYRVAFAEPDLSRVPAALRPLLAACLAKDPAQRPATAQVLGAVGRLDPGSAWLPPAVAALAAQETDGAHRLARVPAPPAGQLPPTGRGPATRSPGGRSAPNGPAHATWSSGGPPPTGPGSTTWSSGSPPPTGPGQATWSSGGPRPAGGPPARARGPVVAALGVGLAALAVAAAVVVPRLTAAPADEPAAELTAEQAAALVVDLLPDGGDPPAGFRVADDPATPEVDGAPSDPLAVDRSRTYFACEVQADPPTPAESGIRAVSGISFQEGNGIVPGRFPDYRFVTVAYLDAAGRGQIVREIRGRIADCRTAVPPGFTAWRFTDSVVPGADETVGFIGNQERDTTFPEFPPRVGACDVARVDAVVIRACALLTNDPADTTPGRDGTLAQDDALRAATRELLEPVVARARELQGP